jgi:hypothetical protein
LPSLALFKSFPFSQAIRVKRICSTVETTKQRLGDLRHHLKKRGYNDKVIESGFSKASEIKRNYLSLCLVVSTVEHIRFTLMAWLNGKLLNSAKDGNYWV